MRLTVEQIKIEIEVNKQLRDLGLISEDQCRIENWKFHRALKRLNK